jgi:hypothetical protein
MSSYKSPEIAAYIAKRLQLVASDDLVPIELYARLFEKELHPGTLGRRISSNLVALLSKCKEEVDSGLIDAGEVQSLLSLSFSSHAGTPKAVGLLHDSIIRWTNPISAECVLEIGNRFPRTKPYIAGNMKEWQAQILPLVEHKFMSTIRPLSNKANMSLDEEYMSLFEVSTAQEQTRNFITQIWRRVYDGVDLDADYILDFAHLMDIYFDLEKKLHELG